MYAKVFLSRFVQNYRFLWIRKLHILFACISFSVNKFIRILILYFLWTMEECDSYWFIEDSLILPYEHREIYFVKFYIFRKSFEFFVFTYIIKIDFESLLEERWLTIQINFHMNFYLCIWTKFSTYCIGFFGKYQQIFWLSMFLRFSNKLIIIFQIMTQNQFWYYLEVFLYLLSQYFLLGCYKILKVWKWQEN